MVLQNNEYRALRIFLKKDVEALFDHFSSLFGIRIAFFSPSGETLKTGVHRSSTPYCKFVRKTLCRDTACRRQDKCRQMESANKRTLLAYRCHAGLVEAVAPIFVSGQLIGFMMIGQIRGHETLPRRFIRSVREKEQQQRLLTFYRALPLVGSGRLKSILFLFRTLVDYILSHHLIEIKRSLVIQQVQEYVESHVSDAVTLGAVARHCCRSETSITHLFKKETGESFKTYLIKRKLAKADEYLRNNPEMPLSEIAEKLGFSDQFHFSHIYRKYKGIAPSTAWLR